MLEKRVFVGVFVLVFLASFVSASPSVSVSDAGVTSVSGAENLYAYEVQFDYTGSASASFGTFLGGTTSSGTNTKNTIFYVYESKLDSSKTGVSGSGTLFTVTHDGALNLTYATFIDNAGLSYSIDYTYCGDRSCNGVENCSTCVTDCGTCGGGTYCGDGTCNGGETTATCSADCKVVGGAGGGGGGGGGGAPTVVIPVITGLELDTNEITLDMVVSSIREKVIRVTNTGTADAKIETSSGDFGEKVVFADKSFVLKPGESKDLKIFISGGDKAEILTGKLNIGGKEILLAVNVKSQKLLFDAMIVIPDSSKQIKPNSKVNAQVTLIPMGDNPRVDVTLNYIVKDYNGKVYLKESETVLVDQQKSFKKQFYTKDLPTGNYILGLELVYPNGVATSSSHFEIAENIPISFKTILISLIVASVVVMGLIVYFIIRIGKKKKIILRRA